MNVKVCPTLILAGFSYSFGDGGQLSLFLPAVSTCLQETQSSWQGHGRAVGLVVHCQHQPRVANTEQQPLVIHSLTLKDVQVALDQAGIFTLLKGLCAGTTELQR